MFLGQVIDEDDAFITAILASYEDRSARLLEASKKTEQLVEEHKYTPVKIIAMTVGIFFVINHFLIKR